MTPALALARGDCSCLAGEGGGPLAAVRLRAVRVTSKLQVGAQIGTLREKC